MNKMKVTKSNFNVGYNAKYCNTEHCLLPPRCSRRRCVILLPMGEQQLSDVEVDLVAKFLWTLFLINK
jgi:hypothetical protein